MKNLSLSLLFSQLFVSFACLGQNLVPNPSFELRNACPDNLDQVYKATDWHDYRDSPDYLHICSTNSNVSIPNNLFGYQHPSSANDSAYCALGTYVQGTFGREYIGCDLTSSLVIGQQYYVSIKVSAAYNSSLVACFTNKIGALFLTTQYLDTLTSGPVPNFAHVYTTQIITDTTNWTLITGSFIADSTYQYLSVGNFFDDSQTDTSSCNSSFAYYYIDYVCVSTDSATCFVMNGIGEPILEQRVHFFPNPARGNLTLEASGLQLSNFEIVFYNLLGETVAGFKKLQNRMQIDISNLSEGVYFVKLFSYNKTYIQKLIIY